MSNLRVSNTEVSEIRRTTVLVDSAQKWIRQPADLTGAVLSLIGIVLVALLAVYARSTTYAVTSDVRTATGGILESILFLPINALEGLVSFFLPVLIILEMVVRRRWRTLGTAVGGAALAVIIANIVRWASAKFWPASPFTDQFENAFTEQEFIALIPYVALISALLTVSGSSKGSKGTRAGWILLAIVLVLSVLQGNQSLPGALITVLIGTMSGLLTRYIVGSEPKRATGSDLVSAIRRGGMDAVKVIRVDGGLVDDLSVWNVTVTSPLGIADQSGLTQLRRIWQKMGLTDPDYSWSADDGSGASSETTSSETVSSETAGSESASSAAADSGNDADGSPMIFESDVFDAEESRRDNQRANELLAAIERLSKTDGAVLDPLADPRESYRRARHTYPTTNPEVVSRNYLVEDATGKVHHVMVLDDDQRVLGYLENLWRRLRLKTAIRHTENSLDDTAEHIVAMMLNTERAGIVEPRFTSLVEYNESILISQEADRDPILSNVGATDVTDDQVDSIWAQIRQAHRSGLVHGNIHSGFVRVRPDRLELTSFQDGSMLASESARQIDLAQAAAMLAASIGVDRAVSSLTRSMPLDQIISLAPLLQLAIMPNETRAAFKGNKEFQALRDALTEKVPEASEVEPVEVKRFSPKTVITVVIGVIAIYVLFTSMNFDDVMAAVRNANGWWMLAAFVVGLFTYLGAGIALKAYTQEDIPLGEATLVQVAASVVTLVAPAGIGPAALNLRFLQKRGVPTAGALASVTVVQVGQFVTTVLLLIVLSLFTGGLGNLSLPSGTILAAALAIVAVIAVLFLIKPVRNWILARIRPTVEQIWPRLVWLATHPKRIVYGFFGSLLMTAAFIACFGLSLKSFGYELPLLTLSVTYLVSNTVGSVIPSPGGIGPVEAALTGGLMIAGIPSSVAFSTAVLYRLLTFWGRVPLGWIALRIAGKREII